MGQFIQYLPLLMLSVGVILELIAIAIPYWSVSKDPDIEWGLWKNCVSGNCTDTVVTGDVKKMRALHLMAVIGGAIACVVYIVRRHVECFRHRVGKPLVIVFSIKTGILIIAADILMAKSMIMYPACHAMSMVSAAFFLFVGGFICTPHESDNI